VSEPSTELTPDDRKQLLEHLRELDDQVFEEFLGDLWDQRGWETEVTSRTKDGGIDVVATCEFPISLTVVIQAKRYSSSRSVSSTEVQQYSSLRHQRDTVDAVAIITTGGFSEQARETAEALNVKILNGDDLCRLIHDTVAYNLVDDYSPEGMDVRNLSSVNIDPLPESVTTESWTHSEAEKHVFEGRGLTDCAPVDCYERGERVHLIHSSSDNPVLIEQGESIPVETARDSAKNEFPVYLHLTSEGVRIFVRETEGDVESFAPYSTIENIYSDSALFGPSESITFDLDDDRPLKFKFQSMTEDVRNEIQRILQEYTGLRVAL